MYPVVNHVLHFILIITFIITAHDSLLPDTGAKDMMQIWVKGLLRSRN